MDGALNLGYFLWTEFPFPKPDMIFRLDGEEESQNSDRWPLPGGSFAGTAIQLTCTHPMGAWEAGF